MKALTLTQPWASLVVLGVKRIETRSWSTKYRGPLAIHAGARQVHHGKYFMLGRIARTAGLIDVEAEAEFRAMALPLGAVVATCQLVDVVPITGSGHGYPDGAQSRVGEYPHDGPLVHQQGGLWLTGPIELTGGAPTHIESERPFGDFTAGRFAWLLADIEPLEKPVPAKGPGFALLDGAKSTTRVAHESVDQSGAKG